MIAVLKIVEQVAEAGKETQDFIMGNHTAGVFRLLCFFKFMESVGQLLNVILRVLHLTLHTFFPGFLLGKQFLFLRQTLLDRLYALLYNFVLVLLHVRYYSVSNGNLFYGRTGRCFIINLIINRLFPSEKANKVVFRFISKKVGGRNMVCSHGFFSF